MSDIRKANPTVSDLHVSTPLSDLSVAFTQDNFVADKIFPVIPVQKQADKYFVLNRQDWNRVDAQLRAPGSEIARSGWRISTDSYFADRIALGHDISDPERANADPAVANLDMDATEYLTQQIRLKCDVDFAAAYFTTSIWDGASSTSDMTGQAAPATTAANFRQWNDVASTPIEDLRGEILSVASRTGRQPNVLTLGPRVWQSLADHPDILDRIKYTERGVVTEDLLASLLGLENVYVMYAFQDSAAEAASGGASFAFVAGKSALLSYRPARPGLRTPSAGYTFVWTGPAGANGALAPRIKKYRLERNESDRIEAELWKDEKVVSSALGAFFATAVA